MNTKLFKEKNFTLLMISKFISLLGSNMLQFALSLYVLAITGSATIFASMLSIIIIPRLLLSPIAGVFGDWFDRKKTITFLNFVNAIIIGVYAMIMFVNGYISIALLFLFEILLEITEIFYHSAMSAILPSIVTKEKFIDANAVNSLITNIGQFLAPIIASIVYAILGLQIILIIGSISFGLSALSKIFIHVPTTNKMPEKVNIKAFKTGIMEGLQVIKNNRSVSSIIGIGAIVNFAISPLFSLGIVYIIKEVFKSSDFQIGLFQSLLSVSMIVAPLIFSNYMKKVKIGRLCFNNLLVIALFIIIMVPVPSTFLLNLFPSHIVPYILLLIISFMVGMLVTTVNIVIGTLFNQIVPLELMGRTSTIMSLFLTILIPISQMIFGYLYDIIAPSYVILLSGIVMLLGLMKYRSILLNIDNQEEGEVPEEGSPLHPIGDESTIEI